ncbi:MAG: hypothetical protein WDZ46_05215 [Solirubrobacterales bacterium]
MLRLDADPGEEPRPSDEPSEGMETEDELAEDLIGSTRQSLYATAWPAGHGPEDDEEEGDGGMETEEETRSPRGRCDQVLELAGR